MLDILTLLPREDPRVCLDQCFSTASPRTSGGPQEMSCWSAKELTTLMLYEDQHDISNRLAVEKPCFLTFPGSTYMLILVDTFTGFVTHAHEKKSIVQFLFLSTKGRLT